MSDTLPTASAGPSWRVVTQTPQLVRLATGGYSEGMRVTAQTPDGTTFSVDVPEAQYTPENVTAMLRAKAATVAAIASSNT